VSALAARFFTLVQGAGFYRQLLGEAVALLPEGSGRTLLDVGCGPGLLTRLAAARGYEALGIDADPAMVAAARRLARRERSDARFLHGRLDDRATRVPQADVVAAASLLAVLPDREAGLESLWRCVKPGGTLLVVEATERLTVSAARTLIAEGLGGPRRNLLTVWAAARQGSAVDQIVFTRLVETEQRGVQLLGGLVRATLFGAASDLAPNNEACPSVVCKTRPPVGASPSLG
jgi:ubiquinone/menaquinone biosynthesis C-methylase UbiE